MGGAEGQAVGQTDLGESLAGKGGKLNYEFRLHPGAKVSDIRLAYAGAEGVSLGADGALQIHTPLGTLKDARPQSFQRIDGRRVPVDSRYALAGHSYGFSVGHHDRHQPLVIDPSLAYSTYLGGSVGESGAGVAVDSTGAAYVTGLTGSADFPTTAGALDTSANGGFDAFVTKLSPTGSSLAYSTNLGGSDAERGFGIAVDSAGSAYVTGLTGSADFPTTAGAFDTSANGGFDAFVTKLSPTGSSLAYSTNLGGSDAERGFGIAVDSAGSAYVTGLTDSADFPTTAAAFDTSANGDFDAFVTKLTFGPGAPCSVTQGGRITANNGDKATFGGSARSNATGRATGHEVYNDQGPAQPQSVTSIRILALSCNQQRTQAMIFGRARISGFGSDHQFRIDVQDLGEPGVGRDTYRVQLDTGYDSGEHTLEGGNVQIHG